MAIIVLAALVVATLAALGVAGLARRSTGRHRAHRVRRAAQQYYPVLRPVDGQTEALADFEAHVREALAMVAENADRCACHGMQECTRRSAPAPLAAEFERLIGGLATKRAERLHAALGKAGGAR